MKAWADQTNPRALAAQGFAMGALAGGTIGAFPEYIGYTSAFFGGIGTGVGVYDVHTNELNFCNGLVQDQGNRLE
jgi:hypothetical protein